MLRVESNNSVSKILTRKKNSISKLKPGSNVLVDPGIGDLYLWRIQHKGVLNCARKVKVCEISPLENKVM